MQEDQQKQLKDMKENIGYYQKKAQELEVRGTRYVYWRLFPFHLPHVLLFKVIIQEKASWIVGVETESAQIQLAF